MAKELPIIQFKTEKAWTTWLDKNHTSAPGVILRFAKKDSGLKSIAYVQAIEIALCYGWIDGQALKGDDLTWMQRFTPRGAKSVWSKINRERILCLIKAGKVKPLGLQAVENAKKNGRWDSAYDSPSTATVPSDLQAELDKSPKAKAFFETLKGSNRYAILHRLQTAKKPETRAKRLKLFVAMLKKKETIH